MNSARPGTQAYRRRDLSAALPSPPVRPALPLALVAFALAAGACRPSPEPPSPPQDPPPRPALALRVDTARVTEVSAAFFADVAYPQLAPAERPAVARVNRAIREEVLRLVDGARQDAAPLAGEVEGTFGPVLLTEDVFSTLLRATAASGGVRGRAEAISFAFDLRTGERLALRNLFRAGTAWLDSLAALATAALAAEHGGTEWLYDGALPPLPEAFPAFTLRPDGLHLVFPPGTVAPYAFGAPEVLLPWTRLAPLLAPDGPAARLLRPDAPAPNGT